MRNQDIRYCDDLEAICLTRRLRQANAARRENDDLACGLAALAVVAAVWLLLWIH